MKPAPFVIASIGLLIFLIWGESLSAQQLVERIEMYNEDNIKSITYYSTKMNKINKVRYEEYHLNGRKAKEIVYKNGKEFGKVRYWDEEGTRYDEEQTKQTFNNRTIKISKDSFLDYPAVWFSPSTGEIRPVKDESPPNDRFIFFIEPNDPEFSPSREIREKKILVGLKLIGNGSNYFSSTGFLNTVDTNKKSLNRGDYKNGNVFYIKTEIGDCLIEIIEFDESEDLLVFNWRKIK